MLAIDGDLFRLFLVAGLLAVSFSPAGAVDTEPVQARIDECGEFADVLQEARDLGDGSLFDDRGSFREGFRLGFRAGFSFRGCLEQVGESNGVEGGENGLDGLEDGEPRWFHEYNLSDEVE